MNIYYKIIKLAIFLTLLSCLSLFVNSCVDIKSGNQINTCRENEFVIKGHLVDVNTFFPYDEDTESFLIKNIKYQDLHENNSWRNFPVNVFRNYISGDFETSEYYAFRNSYQPRVHCFCTFDDLGESYDKEHECCPVYVEVVCRINQDGGLNVIRYKQISPPKEDFIAKMHADYLEQVKEGRGVTLCGKSSRELSQGYLTIRDGFSPFLKSVPENADWAVDALNFRDRYRKKYPGMKDANGDIILGTASKK